jgi:hypothetical protein
MADLTIQQVSLNLLLGVVSGLIGAGIIVFVRSYWEKILLRFEERIY